jgi:hypothetical protein
MTLNLNLTFGYAAALSPLLDSSLTIGERVWANAKEYVLAQRAPTPPDLSLDHYHYYFEWLKDLNRRGRIRDADSLSILDYFSGAPPLATLRAQKQLPREAPYPVGVWHAKGWAYATLNAAAIFLFTPPPARSILNDDMRHATRAMRAMDISYLLAGTLQLAFVLESGDAEFDAAWIRALLALRSQLRPPEDFARLFLTDFVIENERARRRFTRTLTLACQNFLQQPMEERQVEDFLYGGRPLIARVDNSDIIFTDGMRIPADDAAWMAFLAAESALYSRGLEPQAKETAIGALAHHLALFLPEQPPAKSALLASLAYEILSGTYPPTLEEGEPRVKYSLLCAFSDPLYSRV